MKNKNKIFLIIAILLILLVIYQVGNTYAKYISGKTEGVTGDFATWRFVINDQDINEIENDEGKLTKTLNGKDLTIFVDPNNELSKYYSDTILAPGRFGYFDAIIDYSDVTVPFNMQVIATNNSGNHNLIEYITFVTGDETDDEILEDVNPYKTSPISFGTFSEKIYLDEEDTSRTKHVRIYVIWKEANSSSGSSFVDNAFSGESSISYTITFKLNQITEKEPDTTEPDPIINKPFSIEGRKDVISKGTGNDKDEIEIGDIVKLGDENFYVTSLYINDDKQIYSVSMLAMYNLDVNKTYLDNKTDVIQSPNCTGGLGNDKKGNCTIAFYQPFSLDRPPHDKTDEILEFSDEKDMERIQTGPLESLLSSYWTSITLYPSNVYSKDSNTYKYVNDYGEYLRKNGFPSVKANLMTYDEVKALINYEKGTPNWLYETSFWTGDAADQVYVWSINRDGNFYGGSKDDYYDNNKFNNNTIYGIRPLITVSDSEIKEIPKTQ